MYEEIGAIAEHAQACITGQTEQAAHRLRTAALVVGMIYYEVRGLLTDRTPTSLA